MRENRCIIERIKKNIYQNKDSIWYFWRNYQQQEIDYIENTATNMYAYEFKRKTKKKKIPSQFVKNYPHAKFEIIDIDNYEKFLGN